MKTYSSAITVLAKYVKEHNMRPSLVRNLVLEQVCCMPQPFTADLLIKACKIERISVGTVYNALNLFIDAQLLRATTRQRGKAATEYELAIGGTMKMEVICTRCGRITEFHDKAVARLLQDRKYSNFNVAQVSIRVYGECKVCRRRVARGLDD
ncbi:MAG: transcriptional repressor [Paludibacteraceae bacterium]|nr:transcriptional repressor [Paludibacteraceae bacterium]